MVVRSPMVDYIAPWLRARGCLPAVSYWGYFYAVLGGFTLAAWSKTLDWLETTYPAYLLHLCYVSSFWLQLWLAGVRIRLCWGARFRPGVRTSVVPMLGHWSILFLGVTTFFFPHGFLLPLRVVIRASWLHLEFTGRYS